MPSSGEEMEKCKRGDEGRRRGMFAVVATPSKRTIVALT
jgi:hypothetical protein